MPIKPENKALYPSDWNEISMSIRERSGWRCEHTVNGERCKARQNEPHPVTGSNVILTVAHLDHTPENCEPENLKAMCQRCHLRYDAHHHRACDKTEDLFKKAGA